VCVSFSACWISAMALKRLRSRAAWRDFGAAGMQYVEISLANLK
jgi:hypothetical protein